MTYINVPNPADLLHAAVSISTGDVATINVDRTGYWMAFANMNTSNGTQTLNVFFIFNGVSGVSGTVNTGGSSSQWGWSSGYDGLKFMTAGQPITFHIASTGSANNGDMWAIFIPTPGHLQ